MEIRRIAIAPLERARLRRMDAGRVLRAVGVSDASALVRQWRAEGLFVRQTDVSWLRDRYAQEENRAELAALHARAEQAMRREVDFLGSGPVELDDPIDWCTDFKTGHRWALKPSTTLDYALLDLPCDVKVPWELSRFQHLYSLGQCWLLARDPRFAQEFRAQVLSWDTANPVGLGPNWACTMDVALRSYALAWLAVAFADAPELDEVFWATLVRMLFQHGAWIPGHLEYGEVNGNHYISDALGAVVCGALFRRSAAGANWLALGGRIFESEIMLQIEPDGVDIEASVPYQRLVVEVFMTGRQLLERAGAPVTDAYDARLAKSLEYVHAYVLPNGLTPVIGDADDGRVIKFGGQDIRDHRYLLAIGAAWYGRSDWKARASCLWGEAAWFLGRDGAERFAAISASRDVPESRIFVKGGAGVLRTATQYLFVDCGPVGLRGRGGHGHNDTLAFEWHVFGLPVFTDSGAFLYTPSPEWRNRFRATDFHNAVRVDGEEINRFPGPQALWNLMNDALPIGVTYDDSPEVSRLEAAHTGYRRLLDPVTVRRTFSVEKRAAKLTIVDQLDGTTTHTAEFFFQLAPGLSGITVEGTLHISDAAGRLSAIVRPESECRALAWHGDEGWFSPTYGVRQCRQRWRATLHAALPITITWTLTAALAQRPEQ